MSWIGYKLLTQAEVNAAAPSLPAVNAIGGDVYVNLSDGDGGLLAVAGKVVAVEFTAPKVSYSVAFPVSPQPREGVTMYAVVQDIPSELVTENAAAGAAASLDSVAEDVFLKIEQAAHDGALGDNSQPEPTDAQKMAGNYKVGRATLHGMDIAIEQPRGSVRSGVNEKTGVAWSNRMAAHYGYLSGTTGADGDELDIFIGAHPESTAAFVINQVDPESGDFDEHKIMLGMMDQDDAVAAYQNSYDKGWKGLGTVVPATVNQIKTWARTGNTRIPLTAEALQNQGFDNMTPITWTGEQPNAATIDSVLYDIRRHDPDGLLLDSVSAAEIMEDVGGTETFDAVVVAFAKLPRKMEQLQAVMERVSDVVKPVAMQITDPFKQRGAANVATIFELSDGQTLTIFFHNPDATPSKILSTDELISWKWMLNKKDITIVAAPERGADLSIPMVASRIMRLAAKNSPAFQRTNSQRAERLQRISVLKDSVAVKEAQLASLRKTLEVRKIERETVPSAALVPAAPLDQPATEPPVIPDPIEEAVAAGAVVPSLMIETPVGQPGGAPDSTPLADPVAVALAAGEVEPALTMDTPTLPAGEPPAAVPLADPIAEAEVAGAVTPELLVPTENFDPVTAAGYAMVMADPALALKYQDRLDAFFQERIAAVRSVLSDMGWDGIRDGSGDKIKGNFIARFRFKQTGAGNNVVGYSVQVLDGADIQAEIGDCLQLSAAQVAQKIDAVVTNSGTMPPLGATPSEALGMPQGVLSVDPLPEPPVGSAVPVELQPESPAAHLGTSPPPAEAALIPDPIVVAESAGAVSGELQASPDAASVLPDPAAAATRIADTALIQSVIDGAVDVSDPELPGVLEQVIGRIQDDAELVVKWNAAITTYTAAMMAFAIEQSKAPA